MNLKQIKKSLSLLRFGMVGVAKCNYSMKGVGVGAATMWEYVGRSKRWRKNKGLGFRKEEKGRVGL